MAIKQLSVFLENRKGRLQAIVQLLGQAGVNISAISVADTAEFGIIRLIVDKVALAEKTLKDNGVVFHINDVVAIQIGSTPGSLAQVLSKLNDTNINVEYMYTLAESHRDEAVLILRFSDPEAAQSKLQGVTLLSEKDLGIE